MKQKLALCCALINNPKYLILDEPSTGVDAVSRKEFWLLLKKIQNNGVTIVVSTPYMDEAYMCDRIAFIDKGSIFDIDTPQNIIENYPYKLYEIKASKIFKTITVCREYNFVQLVYPFGTSIHMILKDDKKINLLKEKLDSLDIENKINEIIPDIEDCFIAKVAKP